MRHSERELENTMISIISTAWSRRDVASYQFGTHHTTPTESSLSAAESVPAQEGKATAVEPSTPTAASQIQS